MNNKKVILLAREGHSTNIVFNYLNNTYQIPKVILEKPFSRKLFIRNRIRKLGLVSVIGQVLFQLLINNLLKRISKGRIEEILRECRLNDKEIPAGIKATVPSVNSNECLNLLTELKPDLIIVHGTRIISKRIIENTSCPLINIHAGITPKYRGSHGAYWALVNADPDHCGVTVHLVDKGIDTGKILAQGLIVPSNKDNFTTYPYLQLAKGLLLLKNVIEDLFSNKLIPTAINSESKLWYHPTILGYCYNRFFKGIK